MIEAKLQKIIELQAQIKVIGDSIKDFIEPTEDIKKIKKERKILSKTIKELEEADLKKLDGDEALVEFREKKLLLEEDLAKEINEMYEEYNKDGKDFKLTIQTEEGMKVAQGAKLPHVFVDGKEIKNQSYQPKLF